MQNDHDDCVCMVTHSCRLTPLSMGFSRQEYWSGLPFLSPGDFSDLGIKPRSPALEADALTSEPPGKLRILWQELVISIINIFFLVYNIQA